MAPEGRYLALQDRAYALLTTRASVSEAALLAHVYGGSLPASLHAQLTAPLLADPRLHRRLDGWWSLVDRPAAADQPAFTAFAVVSTGPTPGRGRLVSVAALHISDGHTVEQFAATVSPGKRVPAYVAERLGLDAALLEELPPFASIVDELIGFLAARPLVAQEARLAWAFVDADARRSGQIVLAPPLVDANELATRRLDLKGKPTLGLVAAQLGIGSTDIGRPEEEARVLALVTTQLLALGPLDLLTIAATSAQQPLRRGATARAMPDEPGVYVMRGADQTALYVGKARRLRSRVAAYVNRPLGATRRLEGLVGSVDTVDPLLCATDLEALVLEDREIRRLQPRFNTARRQRAPRLWIRLPAVPVARSEKHVPAARRLESSLGPGTADGEFVGPFRNESTAEQARALARRVFDLDTARRGDPATYESRLAEAWTFLRGDRTDVAEGCARQHGTAILKDVLAFDLPAVLLPADPSTARYLVLRIAPPGVEGFIIDRGILLNWATLDDDDVTHFAAALLADAPPRTSRDDADVVLRWLGAQRPPSQLVCLPDDPTAAKSEIEVAALELAFREA